MDLVPYIFHEQQEGNLCAQHCLNALLQGPYFTAIELADLARQLDQRERDALEGPARSSGPPSQNMDDSGFFSVQVISEALAIWQLQIIPWGAQDVKDAKQHPEFEQAFILNLHEHWFTLRRFGPSSKRWYDLNSMHPCPRPMSDTFLGMTLSQLQAEHYSVFVVRPLFAPLVSPEVVFVDPTSVNKPAGSVIAASSSSSSSSSASSSSTATTTTTGTMTTPESGAPVNAFLAERREMERIRRERLEALERQKRGGGGKDAAVSETTGTGSKATVAARQEATVAVIKTPSCLPRCEADQMASTLPLEMKADDKMKRSEGDKEEKASFSGAGYRLGSSGPSGGDAMDEDAMLAAALASSVEDQQGRGGGRGASGATAADTIDDAEWEMMQQAIAMSLQK